MLTGYAPPGWLLKAHPNPRPNLDLKLNPNRISDPDPDPDPNPDQVCFLEVGPARAPLARYLPILMPFYLRCVRHLPYTFLPTYRGLRLLWQPLRMASRRRGGSGSHGPGLPAANPDPNLTTLNPITPTLTLTLALNPWTRRASRSPADRGTVATVRCLVDVGRYRTAPACRRSPRPQQVGAPSPARRCVTLVVLLIRFLFRWLRACLCFIQ